MDQHEDYDDGPPPPGRSPPGWVLRLLAPIVAIVLLLVAYLALDAISPTIDKFFRE
jgi:hypothetical protein